MSDVAPISIGDLGTAVRVTPGPPGGTSAVIRIGKVTTAPSVIGGKNYVHVDGHLMKYCTGLALAVNDIVVYARPSAGQFAVVIGELVI